jgi:AraC-like DNA-binding protein
MQLFIKNMVCQRCIMAVQNEAEKLGIKIRSIRLGELETEEDIVPGDILNQLDRSLNKLGFERIEDKNVRTIEKVKKIIIENIHHTPDVVNSNWSDLITSQIPQNYNYISNLFSALEGITLEQYIIRQKVEKVKELLHYEELTLDEIAYKMNYNSASYLSNLFKKVTGMTPGQFRKLLHKNRKSLDKL